LARGFDIDVTFANTLRRSSTSDLGDMDVTFANTLVRSSAIDLGDIDITFTNTSRRAPSLTSVTWTSPLPILR
jgi:hypothetical protein